MHLHMDGFSGPWIHDAGSRGVRAALRGAAALELISE